MSEERRESPTPAGGADRPPRRPRTAHKQRSVVLYILLLFLAACVLILLSYLMQQRNNAQMLDGLNQSVSAMQSISQLQEDNLHLTEENARLENQVEDLEEQAARLEAERDALTEERDALDRQTRAMDWFWQIDEAYVRSRYTTARTLIQGMAEAGLTAEDLPAESVTDSGRFSPADRYQEIYDRLY